MITGRRDPKCVGRGYSWVSARLRVHQGASDDARPCLVNIRARLRRHDANTGHNASSLALTGSTERRKT